MLETFLIQLIEKENQIKQKVFKILEEKNLSIFSLYFLLFFDFPFLFLS